MGKLTLKSKHRVLCADCTVKENVDRLMQGEKADMVFTDPPYGIDLDTDYKEQLGGGSPTKGRKNWTAKGRTYKRVTGDAEEFNPSHVFENFDYCSEIFIWGANYYWQHLSNSITSSIQVWDKRVSDGLRKMHGNQFELCWSKTKHSQIVIPITWLGAYGSDEGAAGHKKTHPTQKPVKLAERFFDRWGKDSVNIVDLYGGSGSTLIACEKQNKRCFMAEIEPLYIDVIINRFIKFTSRKVVRDDGVLWVS